MSDNSISIVPKKSTYVDKENKATKILSWLISIDVVKPEKSDSILSDNPGYAISEGAKMVTNYPESLPFDLITNGVEISFERQIFISNEIDEMICPNCQKDISKEDWDFFDEWYSRKSDNITCPLCRVASEIHQFKMEPEWGFSDLGFTFWNWTDLTDNFIEEFKNRLGCEIAIVYMHI